MQMIHGKWVELAEVGCRGCEFRTTRDSGGCRGCRAGLGNGYVLSKEQPPAPAPFFSVGPMNYCGTTYEVTR
jgi:hypothetical protein